MGALNNLGGYFLLALTAMLGALQGFVAVCDLVRALDEHAIPARSDAAGAKKDPWGCGSITQEPGQDAA